MKIKFIWSLKTEIIRIIYTSQSIQSNFYQKNNFYILPFPIKKHIIRKYHSNIVIFPNLNFNKISNYWKKIQNINISCWDICKDKNLINQISDQLKELNLPPPNTNLLKKNWKKIQNIFFKKLKQILGEELQIEEIIIYPTYFGSTMSYNVINKYSRKIKIYLRIDQDIISIIKGILSSLLSEKIFFNIKPSFMEKEFLINWLIYKSSLKKIFKSFLKKSNFKPTSSIIKNKQEIKILKKISNNFLKKFNFNNLEINNFYIKNNLIYFDDKPFDLYNFTWQEKRVLFNFIKNKNKIISFDEIYALISKNQNNFSLYALAKFIERLRKKLESKKINPSVIKTIRKQGYVLE